MTERDFKKKPTNNACPFTPTIVFREYKKLKEIASLKDKNQLYELHKKDGSFGINDVKIEELVLADKKTYEGKFIKFYNTDFLDSLNTYSLKIFTYITKILDINNNKVTLDISTVMLRCKIDEPRKVYDGLSHLIDQKIIAKHRNENEYYVNPGIMFRGANRRVLLEKEDY